METKTFEMTNMISKATVSLTEEEFNARLAEDVMDRADMNMWDERTGEWEADGKVTVIAVYDIEGGVMWCYCVTDYNCGCC